MKTIGMRLVMNLQLIVCLCQNYFLIIKNVTFSYKFCKYK